MSTYPEFIELGEMCQAIYSMSRSTQYKLIKKDRLREPIIGPRGILGWNREELEDDLFFGERARRTQKELDQEYLAKIYDIQEKPYAERTRNENMLYKQFREQSAKEIELEDMLTGEGFIEM